MPPATLVAHALPDAVMDDCSQNEVEVDPMDVEVEVDAAQQTASGSAALPSPELDPSQQLLSAVRSILVEQPSLGVKKIIPLVASRFPGLRFGAKEVRKAKRDLDGEFGLAADASGRSAVQDVALQVDAQTRSPAGATEAPAPAEAAVAAAAATAAAAAAAAAAPAAVGEAMAAEAAAAAAAAVVTAVEEAAVEGAAAATAAAMATAAAVATEAAVAAEAAEAEAEVECPRLEAEAEAAAAASTTQLAAEAAEIESRRSESKSAKTCELGWWIEAIESRRRAEVAAQPTAVETIEMGAEDIDMSDASEPLGLPAELETTEVGGTEEVEGSAQLPAVAPRVDDEAAVDDQMPDVLSLEEPITSRRGHQLELAAAATETMTPVAAVAATAIAAAAATVTPMAVVQVQRVLPSARRSSLLSALNLPAEGDGAALKQSAEGRVQAYMGEGLNPKHQQLLGPAEPPLIERDPTADIQEMLATQQQMIAIIERRQELAAQRLSDLRTKRQELQQLSVELQHHQWARAQLNQMQTQAVQRLAFEQALARQEQLACLTRLAQRQKENLKASTESKLREFKKQIREAHRTKKRAEATMAAMFDLETARVRREQAKLERQEAKAAKEEDNIKMLEARQKLLEQDEDVCPPAWDSLSGWCAVQVDKHYSFKLDFGGDGSFGSATLVRSIKAEDFTCQRRERYWKFGSFRVVHLLKLGSKQLVAKSPILPCGPEKDWEDVKATVRQYQLAKEFAVRFVKRLNEKGYSLDMKYVSTDVLKLTNGDFVSTEPCAGREFRESDGEFIKWNNNSDYVREDNGDIDPYPQALSHFSYVESKHSYLLTDVQGWKSTSSGYILTDPALHSNDREGVARFPGDSDHGYKGMGNFFAAHRCNDICRLLDLHNSHKPKPPRAVGR